MIVLDSSVVIPLLDPEHVNHQFVHKLWTQSENEFGISTLSLTEATIKAIKKDDYESIFTFELVEKYLTHFVIVSVALAKRAAHICAIKGLKAPDGIIVATAELNDLELWTCDEKMAESYSKAKNLLAN